MGTNYYVRIDVPCCETCNRPLDELDEELHIGKSSMGWVFALHVIPESRLDTWNDWKIFLKDKKIFDEYGKEIPLEQLTSVVTKREGREKNWNEPPAFYNTWEVFHECNHSIIGPKNLLRAQIDGRHCVGHGPGTWDYIAGDFS